MARNNGNTNEREPLLTIGAVAEMLDLHQQTLRKYEEEGLIHPRRTVGKTRMYSLDDVERLRLIITLTRDLGLNIAGVEIVLRMRDEMDEMRRMMDFMLEQMDSPLREQARAMLSGAAEGLVPVSRIGEGLVPFSLLREIMGERGGGEK
jgi:MerR family transcriptional regulator, heat shock protein HspR